MKIGACISQHTALHSASLHCWLMVYAFMNPFGWLSSELLTTIEMQIGIFIKCACDVLSRLFLVQSPYFPIIFTDSEMKSIGITSLVSSPNILFMEFVFRSYRNNSTRPRNKNEAIFT